MAKHTTPDDSEGLAGPPRVVEVTWLPDPDARPLRERIVGVARATRARVIVMTVLVLAIAAIGAVITGVLVGGRNGAVRSESAGARHAGAAGVAAAYGYPLRCLSVTIAPTNPMYARADFDRRSLCGRYDGSVTAIFHRVDDAWRPVLDATSYSCPVASLSAAVQTELGVCP